MKQYVYDTEVFPNFFCVIFLDYWTNEEHYFEISEWRDDSKLLKEFVKGNVLLGYNNMWYDNIIINFIMQGNTSNYEIYNLSNMLIHEEDLHLKIKKWKYNKDYISIDLMRLIASKAKRVSLKELQVLTKWYKVQDYDKDFTEAVLECEIPQIKEYCKNDVESTKHVANIIKGDIDLRIKIQKEYGLDCLSKDSVNTGVDLFALFYERDSGDSSFKERRTKRPIIFLDECISDLVKFKSKEFNELLTKLKAKTITQTKGAIDFKVLYGGVMHVYGTGGIHSKDRPGITMAKDDELYIDADVGSLYPSLLINLRACPAHLDPNLFIPRYKWLRDTRIAAKKEKNMLIADTFKLALNGTYGNLINEYSWLFDPQAAMTINKVVVNKRG